MRLLSRALSLDIEPTLADVKKALSDIQNARHDQFLILEQDEMNYIKTLFFKEGYVLEYRSGSSEERFRSKGTLNKDSILKLFELYFQGDILWKRGIEFEKIIMPKPMPFRLGYFVGVIVNKIQEYLKHK